MPGFVSIIVPCYNEESTIGQLLAAVRDQTYLRDLMEVVIADGKSTDRTRQVISAFQADCPNLAVTIIENENRAIPSALNRAISHSRGEIIMRLDAHSIPLPDYVERAVSALESGKGTNVGGTWEIRAGARTWMADSIAAAAAHPLGAGDASYRLNPQAGAVDTVPFGCFRRELIEKIGGFDEGLLTNEDYEFNARIRKAGGTVWLEPGIRSVYFARASLDQLARQYWRYGFWKWQMLRRYPQTARLRQILPPVFMLSLVGLSVLSLWLHAASKVLMAEVSVYAAALILAGLHLTIRKRKPYHLAGFPLAIAVMHFAWAAGFLWSMIAGSLISVRHD